jgi:hypothetical protein
MHCPERTHQTGYVLPFSSFLLTLHFGPGPFRQFTLWEPPMMAQYCGREILPRASSSEACSEASNSGASNSSASTGVVSGVGFARRPSGRSAPTRRVLICMAGICSRFKFVVVVKLSCGPWLDWETRRSKREPESILYRNSPPELFLPRHQSEQQLTGPPVR